MKPLNPEYPLALQAAYRRSPIHLFEVNRAPAWFALLLLASIPAAQADTLGRLFFTPEQRKQLDYSYARTATTEGNSSPVLTVNGIVQKQGGARTVWINGVPQSAGINSERTPTAQTVSVPGSRPVKLKVGEKILLDQPVPASPNATDH
jgi:hypothetical protein